MIEARPNHRAEDSYDTTRPELSEKRPNQEARRPVYSSYDAEESNFIGTSVAEPTKIIRKAPLPHCDEKSLSHGAAGCQTDQTNNKKKQHNTRHHVANHRQWCTCQLAEKLSTKRLSHQEKQHHFRKGRHTSQWKRRCGYQSKL